MKNESNYKILMVDDEPLVLSGFQRTIGRAHSLTVAEGGAAGLTMLQTAGPFAVVITDMRMPKMTGLEFIEAARPLAKESVFMMLTGNADQKTAVDAINQGRIFRFLNKPCPPEQLDQAIRGAIRQYELITTERVILRETLTGSVKLLTDALEMSNPGLASIQTVVKQVHEVLCTNLGITRDWQMLVASSLCLIGLVTVPGLNQDLTLSDEVLDLAATLGHRMIKNLPRLLPVSEMILHQRDLRQLPEDLKSAENATAVGSGLLRYCVDLAREQRRCGSFAPAVAELKSSGAYDKRLFTAVEKSALLEDKGTGAGTREIPIEALEQGMVVDANIQGSDGVLILVRGQPLTVVGLASLRNYHKHGLIKGVVPIRSSGGLARAA